MYSNEFCYASKCTYYFQLLYPWTLLKPADQIPRDNSGLLVDLFYTHTHTHTHMCLLVCIGFNHYLIYLSFTPFFSGNPGFLF